VRYDVAAPRATFSAVVASRPRYLAQTTTLVTRRLRSHSHGPGSVSVEVVDAEHEVSLGGAEDAEVRDVRVAARLDLQTGDGSCAQVQRHHLGGAPEERERRCEHPRVPDGNQAGDALPVLRLEHRDGIGSGQRGLVLGLSGAWDAFPQLLSGCEALLDRRPPVDARSGGPCALFPVASVEPFLCGSVHASIPRSVC
jgi:hypothetical protein